MEGFKAMGIRKGAWTEEEDNLLRKCILKYGEGRWYQVPFRAGLNRCRKSCRLRWLNYLKPNIKRGEFKEDEVDLIIKLHKLLGNRWSLIAGRLPGRTANDIKNYWNTHLNRKKVQPKNNRRIFNPVGVGVGVGMINDNNMDNINGDEPNNNLVKTTVFKPRPRTFSKTSPWIWKNNNESISQTKVGSSDINIISKQYSCCSSGDQTQLSSSIDDEVLHYNNNIPDKWWESLLFESKEEEEEEEVNHHMNNSERWWEHLLSDKEEDRFHGTTAI